MEKLRHLFVLFLLSLVGTGAASAQYYAIGSEVVPAIEEGKTYALRTATSFDEIRLLSAYECSGELTADCLYTFEKAGRQVDGHDVWFLKQQSTGKYLKHHELSGWEDSLDNPPHDKGAYVAPYIEYTADVAEAFGFTILPVDTTAATGTYRTRADEAGGAGAQDISEGFVLCSESTHFDTDGTTIIPTYLGNYAGPFLSPWTDCNVWKIHTLAEAEGKELLELAKEDVGRVSATAENFPVGENSGQVGQADFDRYEAALRAVNSLLSSAVVDNEEAKNAVAELIAANRQILEARKPVQGGKYYFIKSKATATFMYDGGDLLCHDGNVMSTVTPTEADAKYIFCVEEIGSHLYLKNFSTGNYVASYTSGSSLNGTYPTNDDASQHTFLMLPDSTDYFYIWNEGNDGGNSRFAPAGHNNTVTAWNSGWVSVYGERLWQFVSVDDETIEHWAEVSVRNTLPMELEEAKTLAEYRVEGTNPGMYQAGSKNTLLEVVTKIKGQMTSDWTLEQVAAARRELAAAVSAFEAALVLPVPGKVYTIRSTSLKRAGANGQYVCGYLNGAIGYGECENVLNRPDCFWYFEPSSDGKFKVKNFGYNYGISKPAVSTSPNADQVYANAEGTDVALSIINADATKLDPVKGAYSVKLHLGKNAASVVGDVYLNVGSNGRIVVWNDLADPNSAFVIEEAEFNDIKTLSLYTLKGVPRVLYFPFEYKNNLPGATLCEPLGKNGDKLMLSPITTETIPAATPVIYFPDERLNDTISEVLNIELALEPDEKLEFVLESKTVNGLRGYIYLSAFAKEQPDYNYEIDVFSGRVRETKDHQTHLHHEWSGYFLNLPETDEVSEMYLEIDDEITGISPNGKNFGEGKVDVYSIDGKLVRSRVKAASALEKLPAGVYVVGGKKILVK